MILYDERLKPLHGYEEGRADSIDPDSSAKALSYKKDFLKRFIPLDARQIENRLAGDRFYVTRKYDGEYAFIIHDHGQTVTVNRSGRVRRGIPCIEEAGRLLDAAGVAEGMFGAEIYAVRNGKRGRLKDLLSALADSKRTGTLHLAVFDLVELDARPWRGSYDRTWNELHALFCGGELVREVDMETVGSPAAVLAVYDKWVVREKSEGLVVRTDLPFVYKIKPRHTIDAVVVGFSEGAGAEKGQARSLLLALMPAAGRYQVVGRVGSGMVEEVRELLFDRLSKQVLPSEYIETDANLVAFRMVRPDTVIELTVGDLLYETEAGPKMNPLLEIADDTYRIVGSVEGLKFLAPVFVRIRTDKRADAADVRLTQIERFATADAPPLPQVVPAAELPKSKLLFRDVYMKTIGRKTMIQKYMVWKTNKEHTGDFPAYVLYVANFSPGRLEPLRRDVDVTDSPVQIRELLKRSLEKNLRGGWRKVSSLGVPKPEEGLHPEGPEAIKATKVSAKMKEPEPSERPAKAKAPERATQGKRAGESTHARREKRPGQAEAAETASGRSGQTPSRKRVRSAR